MVINHKKIASLALYLFMFSINFEMLNLLGDTADFSVGRLTGYLYMVAFIFAKYSVNFEGIKHLLFSLIVFVVIITLSSALHLNSISLKIVDISLLQNIVLFFMLLIHERNDPGVIEKSIYPLVLGTAASSVFYLLAVGIEYEGGRLSLFGDNQNTIGMRMAISIVCIIYLLFMSEKRISMNRVIMILPITSMLPLMLETGSRVAFISFILMIIVLLVLYFIAKPIKRFIPLLFISAFGAYFAIPFFLSHDLIIDRLLASTEGDLSLRDDIWRSYIPYIWENPIIGYGYSGFEEIAIRVFGMLRSPHNVIIEIMLYGGIIGLLAFIYFLFQALYSGLRNYLLNKKSLGLVLMIAYFGQFISGQVLVTKVMWFILAFNCTLLLYKNRSKINLSKETPADGSV